MKLPKKILFTNYQAPGDVLVLTATIRDLHRKYPNKYLTDVDTTAMQIWENNPHITKLDWTKENETIKTHENIKIINCKYPLIDQSNTAPYHFLHAFAQYIETKLRIKIPLTEAKGDIHLSEEEKNWISQAKEKGIENNFWIVIAGGKYDFTAKWYPPERHQHIINYFKDKITFIQCGESHGPPLDQNGNKTNNHFHPQLKNVVDLRGQTDIRQFIRLMYHASGVLCPVTFAMHLAAAVETKTGPKNRPCVVIAGGREPMQWEAYPHHQYIHKNGCLPCCEQGGCWKSRCQLIGDKDEKDTENVCENYTQITPNFRIPRCMDMIHTGEVIRRIESYYEGGALRYDQH